VSLCLPSLHIFPLRLSTSRFGHPFPLLYQQRFTQQFNLFGNPSLQSVTGYLIMATDTKRPVGAKPKDTASWGILQMVAFTLIGALSATVLSNYGPLSKATPKTEIVEIGVPVEPVEPGIVSPVTEASPKVKVLSFDPFIAHIADFISPSERKYLMKLGCVKIQTLQSLLLTVPQQASSQGVHHPWRRRRAHQIRSTNKLNRFPS
jgi:hypothetical protein